MLKFSIDPSILNSFLKRASQVIGTDKTVPITVVQEKKTIKVFYKSSSDKASTTSGIFVEELEVSDLSGSGTFSTLFCNFSTLKVPEYVDDSRFPQCKSVSFCFNTSILTVQYAIVWSEDARPNLNKHNYPILTEEVSLLDFESLFEDSGTSGCQLETTKLTEGINLVQFLKTDATSKDSNGCLLKINNDLFSLTATDSNIAVKYQYPVISGNITKAINVVLSANSLNIIKTFMSGEDSGEIRYHKSKIYAQTSTRKMIVPIMDTSYLIADPDTFFDNKGDKIANLDLKAFVHLSQFLVNKSKDFYKKLIIKVTEALALSNEVDTSENVPAAVFKEAVIPINGSFMVPVSQKLLTLDLNALLFYDKDSGRVTLTSKDDRLIFLIQGLSD